MARTECSPATLIPVVVLALLLASTAVRGQPLPGRSLPGDIADSSGASASSVFEPAETIAQIGEHSVFRGDLLGDANLIMATILEKMPEEDRQRNRAQIEAQREELLRQLLKQVVDRKLMYVEFMRQIPVEKLKEARTNMEAKVDEAFESDLEGMLDKLGKSKPDEYAELGRQDPQLFRLALIMKEKNLSGTSELERLLRQHGSSLRKQQEAYLERHLGQQQMRKEINFQPEITHEEMLQFYHDEPEEFRVPAKARWEQLTARFDRYPDREACGRAIAAMGNEVRFGGAPFWAVAKRNSQGLGSDQGGYHDWTEWGKLTISPQINEAVFSLPVQEMSRIIEDGEGYHIVRVIERRESHLIPFSEAQTEIKQKLQAQKRAEAISQYVARLRKTTPVWTIYDATGGENSWQSSFR